MRTPPMLMILLLASGSIFAQAKTDPSTATLTPSLPSQGCPVNFYAKRTGGLVVHYAKDGHQDPTGQGLDLAFSKNDASRIEKIIVTVHGMSAQGDVLPVRNNSSSDIAETFILERHPGATTLDSEIWTRKIGPVRWVELTQIEFANGSVWQKSKESKCITEPSPLLLVDATASVVSR